MNNRGTRMIRSLDMVESYAMGKVCTRVSSRQTREAAPVSSYRQMDRHMRDNGRMIKNMEKVGI